MSARRTYLLATLKGRTTISRRRTGEYKPRGAADRGEYRQVAGVVKPPSLIQMSCFVVMSGIAGSTSKSSRRFRSRRSMNFANAIKPKTSRHSTTNMTMLFVGVGKFAGNHIFLQK